MRACCQFAPLYERGSLAVKDFPVAQLFILLRSLCASSKQNIRSSRCACISSSSGAKCSNSAAVRFLFKLVVFQGALGIEQAFFSLRQTHGRAANSLRLVFDFLLLAGDLRAHFVIFVLRLVKLLGFFKVVLAQPFYLRIDRALLAICLTKRFQSGQWPARSW